MRSLFMICGILSFVFMAGSALALPSSTNADTSFRCGDMDGTNVRDGEYFFPDANCSSGDRKICNCEMTGEPPTNENCSERDRDRVQAIGFARSTSTRNYRCYCTTTNEGKGMRCSTIILPQSQQFDQMFGKF